MKKSKLKIALVGATSVAMALSMSAVSFADDAQVTTWADLYKDLGINASTEAGYYDSVTSASKFTSHHAKDIPALVNKVKDGDTVIALDGVNLTGKAATVTPAVGEAYWESFAGKADNKQYGTDELVIKPDESVEGYKWDEYEQAMYAVTIEDQNGNKAGAVPWIDYYGETTNGNANSPHHNKIEIALNNGPVHAGVDNGATVHRFDAFYTDGVLNPGVYTVTVYAEGYAPLTAQIKVPTQTKATVKVEDVNEGTAEAAVTFDGLPEDYEPGFVVDGKEASYTNGKISVDGLKVGNHTVTVKDTKEKYNNLSASFLVKTDKVPAQFSVTKLVAAQGASEEAFAGYLKGISSVKVGERTYAATGRGAKVVIKEDGSIDLSQTLSVQTTGKINFVVTAPGYPELTFTATAKNGVVVAPEAPKPAATVKKPVVKKANTMTVTSVNKTYKAKKLKKKARSFTAITVKKSQGKVTMTAKPVNAKAKKALKFNKGKITVAKKTKKGTYQMKVTVKAAGNSGYNAKTVVKTITVKVK